VLARPTTKVQLTPEDVARPRERNVSRIPATASLGSEIERRSSARGHIGNVSLGRQRAGSAFVVAIVAYPAFTRWTIKWDTGAFG